AGYIDTWGRGTLKIINSCKEAGLPEPEIKEMNGGVEVTIFNLQQQENSEGIRDDFGMISERIRKEFGSISERIVTEPSKNLDFIQRNYEVFKEYLQANFGITSEKFGKEFGKRNSNLEYCFRSHCTLS
ncbi:MAG: hypothetical protein Q8J97_15715, partial [Flavobacteriaceae bacterium]|nr:hypothetical protein [Flavobacteriaceae bacterium]